MSQSDPYDRPYEEDDALTSPESLDTELDHVSEHTEDVEMDPDGSGRVVTDADRGEGQTFDPTGGDQRGAGDGDSTDAGRAG